jgi:hypothetical protein
MREAVKEMMKARRTAQPFEPALNDEETEDSTAHLKQVIQAQDHTTEVTSQPAQSIAPPKRLAMVNEAWHSELGQSDMSKSQSGNSKKKNKGKGVSSPNSETTKGQDKKHEGEPQ